MGDVGADAGVLRDLDALGCRNIPLRPAARSFAGRGPPSKGESLDPGHAFYQLRYKSRLDLVGKKSLA